MIRFDIEWLDAAGFAEPALAATYGRLAIRSDGETLTAAHDRLAGSHVDAVYVSVLPLAEWMLANYFFVLEERRVPWPLPTSDPIRTARLDSPARLASADLRAWRARHAIRAGREGWALPEVVLWRQDGRVSVGWAADEQPLPGCEVRFVSQGRLDVPPGVLDAEMVRLLDAVALRLERVPETPRARDFLERLAQLRAISRVDRRRQQLLARLGFERAPSPAVEDFVTKLAGADPGRPPTVLLETVLACADPERLGSYASWADAVVARAGAWASDMARLQVVVARAREQDRRRDVPWATGWARAEIAREVLGLPASRPPGALGVAIAHATRWNPETHVVTVAHGDPGLDTVVAWLGGCAPGLVLTRRYAPEARRFRVARALHAILFEAPPTGHFFAAASPRVPGALSVANAFAAELLAPAAAVEAALPPGAWFTPEDVAGAARKLGVDRRVVEHQVTNRRLGTIQPA